MAGSACTPTASGPARTGGWSPWSSWGIPPGEPRAVAAANHVLAWLASPGRRVPVAGGLTRAHASIEGNALAVCCRLGLAADRRVQVLAEALIGWQWPDGGWNCDPAATRRSSFHESLAPAWALHEYGQATGDTTARDTAGRAAELFLTHRLFRSLATGQMINRAWLAPRYPPYWQYDILHALLVLSRMGKAVDPRTGDALDELERRRRPDGRWQPGGYWWKPPTSSITPEVVDWGRSGPNEMITLNALRVLRAASRLT